MDFGDWLRAEIKRRGLSISEFARRIGVRHGTVSRWLSATRRPDSESANRIARVLGVPPAVVTGQLGPQRPPTTESETLEQRLARLLAERAALGDEDRRHHQHMDDLDREIDELELTQRRLLTEVNDDWRLRHNSSPVGVRQFTRQAEEPENAFVLSGPPRRSDEQRESHRDHRTAAEFMMLRHVLQRAVWRLPPNDEANAFMLQVSDDWSTDERMTFAIGLRLGLLVGSSMSQLEGGSLPDQGTTSSTDEGDESATDHNDE